MSRLQAFGLARVAALSAIAAVALYRIAPHLPNLTPVGAMFALGGLYLGRSLRWMAVPFAALIVSDLVIYLAWNGQPFEASRLVDYAGFALVGLAARWASDRGLGLRVASVVAAPVIFFIVSNFGVWALGSLYPHTGAGLVDCYVAALPFFRGTAIGDLLFGGVGLAVIELLRQSEGRRRPLAAA